MKECGAVCQTIFMFAHENASKEKENLSHVATQNTSAKNIR